MIINVRSSPMMYFILCFSILFVARIQFTSSEIVHSHLKDDLLHHHHTASVSPDFAHFSLVQPSYFHSRTKRQISSTKLDKDSTEHIIYLTVKYSINNTLYTLDLILNRDLLSTSYFEKHQLNGAYVIRNRTNTKDIELCHYKGVLRDVPGSWAAISTCDNILRGVVFDGTELNYIEPSHIETISNFDSSFNPNLSQHIVYKHSDYLAHDRHNCGHKSAHDKIRTRRDTVSKHDIIRGPYNANSRSRYLELVLVVDNRLYNLLNKDSRYVYRHCKDIVNVINALYEKLNIFVALVGVVVWTEYDEISFNPNGDVTLTNFLTYRRERLVRDHPNDNAQLLTGMTFQEGVVGKALKGPICTYEFSGGINVDHNNTAGLVATTVAHEMGHNLGMEHDTDACKCPGERCIMSPSSSSVSPTEWSSCSMEYLAYAFDHGMDYCMRNKPRALFDGPVCGNGFVEDGEECDCGLADACKNACCNAATCTLYGNATCATGSCCNLETCQPHNAGKECRSADRECDLPEFCTGDSEFCPEDVFKLDGELCKGGEAFCYGGSCRTHSDQCRLLWGPSGKSSDKQCFNLNTSGSRRGNCGHNKVNQTYSKCSESDILCGMLHCEHLSEKLEFGIETVALLSHSFINVGESIAACRSVSVDLGLSQVDPGLSPDGARCGKDSLCVNRKCMSVEALRASMPVQSCPFNCHDQGVCNSRGHCHCHPGFAPPYCEYPGVGGSSDSGPASDPNGSRIFITLFYALSVAVLPLSALILFLKYYNNHPKSFWWKRPGVSRLGDKKKSTSTPSAKGMQNHSNSGGSGGRGGQLLLPGGEQNYNLLGAKTYKSAEIGPTRPAPVKPTPPKLPSDVHLPTRAAPKIPSTSARLSDSFTDYVATLPPELPPANKPLIRPLIGAPVLSDTTSQTVRELIEHPAAPRHSYAGPSPPGNNLSSNPFLTSDQALRASNPGPLSAKSSTLPPVHIESKALPRLTNGPSTLNRIASFMSRNSSRRKSKTLTAPVIQGSSDSVRSLEISQPILQNGDVAIPLSNLAADKAAMIKRTQSMRETDANFKRPNLPAFGSMRAKRPASLAGTQRPSQPPPPAPSGITSMPGYQTPSTVAPASNAIATKNTHNITSSVTSNGSNITSSVTSNDTSPNKPKTYDDCLNLLSDSLAALAHVSHNPSDNIYAVIEESPPPSRSPPESLGLLGEIVSEIQARNTESIYSSNSLIDSNKLYMNTRDLNNVSPDPTIKSTTSSGYLSPINPINSAPRDDGNADNFDSTNCVAPSIPCQDSKNRSTSIDPSTSSYRFNSSSSSTVPSSRVSHNVPSSSASKPSVTSNIKLNSSIPTSVASNSYENTSNVSSKPPSTSSSTVNSSSLNKPLVSSLHSSSNKLKSSSASKPITTSNSIASNNTKPSISSSTTTTTSNSSNTPVRPTTLSGLKSTSTTKPILTGSSITKSSNKPTSSVGGVSSNRDTSSTAKPIDSPTAKLDSSKPVFDTPASRKGSATSYKPFASSRGPMSGNTVSSYNKPLAGKPVLPVTSNVSSMLSKPAVPQRPAGTMLKRPDLISSCSAGPGNAATSPDVVNKGKSHVASLQQKFESH